MYQKIPPAITTNRISTATAHPLESVSTTVFSVGVGLFIMVDILEVLLKGILSPDYSNKYENNGNYQQKVNKTT